MATALAGLVAAMRLRVSADIATMLPVSSPAAAAYRELLEVFGTFEKIAVLIRLPAGREGPAESDPLTDAALLLEEMLAESPDVAEVRVGISDSDERFFLDHLLPRAALFLPEDELAARVGAAIGEEALAERARELARRVQLPGGEFVAPLLVRDPLGFAEGLPNLELTGWGIQVDLLTGMFRSADGRAALAIVTPRGEELDAAMGHRLLDFFERARARLRREVDPELELMAVGGPLYAAEDESLIRRDLESTVGGSVAVCLLILMVGMGGWRVPALTAATIGVALVWTAGTVGLVFGHLVALSLGFAAALIGLGVDYCIHGATRFDDAVRSGATAAEALERAIAVTGPAILASALTSATGFGVLLLSPLRPLAELGALVAVGMLTMLLATYAVGAPLALLLLRRSPPAGGAVWRAIGVAVDAWARAAERRPRATLLAATMLVVVIAVPGLWRLRFDTDLRAIRPAEHATVVAENAVAEAFALGFDTATVLVDGRSPDEALAIARRASTALRATLGGDATIESPSDWTLGPGEKAGKLALLDSLPLGAAADRFEVELRRAGLQPKAFAPGLLALRELGEGRDPAPPAEDALPGFVRESVHARPDGSALLAIHLRFASDSAVAPSIEKVLESAGVPARVASTRNVAVELASLAERDARRLGLLAAVGVSGLVWLSFRGRWSSTWRSLLPVASGSTVTLGAWGLLGFPLDLLSVAVLPILFGIGIDDGLHVVHGAEGAGGDGDLGAASRLAGRAMVLTTATNAAGFASLLLSSIPSLRRAGVLLAVGIVVCLLTTITLLPALGAVRGPRGAEPEGGRAP